MEFNKTVLFTFLATFIFSFALIAQKKTFSQSYHGIVDDRFPLELEMEVNGKEVVAQIKYENDELLIQASGDWLGNQIKLIEYNQEKDPLANWDLKKVGDGWQGWIHLDDQSAQVVLKKEKIAAPAFAWNATTEQGDQILLQSISAKELEGGVFLENQKAHYTIQGSIAENGNIFFELFSSDNSAVAKCQMESIDAKRIIWQWEEGKTEMINIKSSSNVKFISKFLSKSTAQFYFLYPETGHANFDLWLNSEMDQLWNRATTYEAQLPDRLNKAFRNRLQANAIVKLNFINDKYISAEMQYVDSWSAKVIFKHFVYDLVKSKEATAAEVFANVETLKSDTRDKIAKAKKDLGGKFSDWLKDVELEDWALLPAGIWVGAETHAIFGKVGVTYSYDEIKSYLKPDHSLNHF